MDLHPDFSDLLAEFARENVSYAVIGGYAVGHHARPRATKDLIVYERAAGRPQDLADVALLGGFADEPN